MQDAAETGARLRAARALAGFDSRRNFATFLGMPGFGEGTIRATEQGERELRPQEIALVAERCGLPRTFFTAERAALGPGDAENPDAEVIARLERIERMLSAEESAAREGQA